MSKKIIAGVGAATFFFGFGAGAILNLYLLSIHSPLVENLRSSLTFKSAIYGDGIILPIVNMVAVAFLIKHKPILSRRLIVLAGLIGLSVTAYFHVDQATKNLVNWAMPTPWHWNLLGLWHAIYMLSVTSFLSLFFLVALKVTRRGIPFSVLIVLVGLVAFFILLGKDYY